MKNIGISKLATQLDSGKSLVIFWTPVRFRRFNYGLLAQIKVAQPHLANMCKLTDMYGKPHHKP